mgnify:FL=1
MGCQTTIQLIKRKHSEQWYVNFPAAIAQAMDFSKGERFEWIIEAHGRLVLRRLAPLPPAPAVAAGKKKRPSA